MNVKQTVFVFAIVLLVAVATAGYAQNQTTSDRNTVTVPTGTKISVRNDAAIDSQNAAEGQTYPATVIQEVQGSAGEVLVRRSISAEMSLSSFIA